MTDSPQPSNDRSECSESLPTASERSRREVAAAGGPVGVIFALQLEATQLLSRIDDATTIVGKDLRMTRGKLAGQPIVVAVSGPGASAARRATTAMIDGHAPRLVVSAGLAGSLVQSLSLGRIVLPDLLLDSAGRRLAVDTFPAGKNEDSDFRATAEDRPTLALVTVDRVVTSPEPKAELRESSGARAVDMETFHTADVCLRCQVPFTPVRVIGDSFDRQLPDDVESLLRSRNPMRQIGAALRSVWRNPSRAKDLFLLKRDTDRALKSLDRFLAAIFERSAARAAEKSGEPAVDSIFGRIGPPREV